MKKRIWSIRVKKNSKKIKEISGPGTARSNCDVKLAFLKNRVKKGSRSLKKKKKKNSTVHRYN